MSGAPVHLILGGARSGKSTRGETLGLSYAADAYIYVATAQALDGEMAERIARHRDGRDPRWRTVEEPLDLAGALRREARAQRVVLVDCLTLWLSNILLAGQDPAAAGADLVAVLKAGRAAGSGPVLCVSNEVGLGLVPDTALGRTFRDAQGRINQQVAAVASHVDFMVAGLPMAVKAP